MASQKTYVKLDYVLLNKSVELTCTINCIYVYILYIEKQQLSINRSTCHS